MPSPLPGRGFFLCCTTYFISDIMKVFLRIFLIIIILMCMRSLELFSGLKSVSKVLQSRGFDTWTVDYNQKLSPRLCCDILDFPFQSVPTQFSFIWASPDCRSLSRIGDHSAWQRSVIKYRQYDYTPICLESARSVAQVEKTIEIIKRYSPTMWVIENPIGRMRHLDCVRNFPHYRYCVNYKDWGFDYSKETDIFTNIMLPFPTRKVLRFGKSVVDINNRAARSAVPGLLVDFILNYFPNT